jgi:hypothetical protein
VVERFRLYQNAGQTVLRYEGEMGTDLWAAGAAWGNLVAARWEATVQGSFDAVKSEAERRPGR